MPTVKAFLVYDGGPDAPRVPPSMGTPTDAQLKGTPLDQLGELASRICYDSLGYHEDGKPKGRSSEKLHQHILEVKNHSVYEHGNVTVRFNGEWMVPIMLCCLNRKGVWVYTTGEDDSVEVTLNLRCILEWERHNCAANQAGAVTAKVAETLRFFGHHVAPQIIKRGSGRLMGSFLKTEGLTEDQAHITLYLHGSRGFTHEQVRHRFAMSQRSTRYVDETDSEYVLHPLLTKYLTATTQPLSDRIEASQAFRASIEADRHAYSLIVDQLEAYGTKSGLDRLSARKQARGAARGFLGNALASEMLFTAPVSGWKWILSQRLSPFADAEIRAIYDEVLPLLKASRYGHFFSSYETVPSPDGIGNVLASTP